MLEAVPEEEEPRWYYARVDFGPGLRSWLTALSATSATDARAQLQRELAAEGVAATIREVGLLAGLATGDGDATTVRTELAGLLS